jgi:3-oxoacyl-[acyl-carrier protein] reductase
MMKKNTLLETIIVTGGTKGIGAAIVTLLKVQDVRIIATGTKKDQITELNREKKDNNIEYIHLDFREVDSINKMIERINNEDKIKALISNAGVNKIDYIYDIQEEDWDYLMTVNLKGIFLLTKSVSKKMKKQKSGRILNISSVFGVVSKAKRASYSTTKFGLIGFTKGLALDLAPHNILVNALSPGFVLTELTKSILTENEIGRLTKDVPLQRFAQPEEIAKCAAFLVGDDNTYITGQNIIIDGGFVSA